MKKDNLLSCVDVLKKQGRVILIDALEEYEESFKNRVKVLPSKDYWENRKVLITGINGFVGSHLTELLLSLGCEVHGLVRRRAVPYYVNIEHLRDKINLHACDILSSHRVNEVLKEVRPSVIFHLAAESFVPTSFREPTKVVDTNVNGSINLLEAARGLELDGFHVACSSEQYGKVLPSECPITESSVFNPRSVYGITKIALEHLSKLYHVAYGIPSVITRGFNHTGPRRGLEFVTSVITRQVAKCIKYGQKKLFIGNVNVFRDFTDVRDIVRGYALAVERGKRGEPYVLASGKTIQIMDLCELAMKVCGVSMEVVVDESRYRPAEVPLLVGDPSKARDELGWEPVIPLTKTVKDMVNYFLKHKELLGVESH